MSATVESVGTGTVVPAPPAGRVGGDVPEGRDRRRRRWPWAIGAVVAAAAVTGGGYAAEAGWSRTPPVPAALGPGNVTVEIRIEHSRFVTPPLRVAAGSRVRFVVVNGDPIAHEFIVGPRAVHDRHEKGTEARHPSIPGEVSVDAEATAVTTFRFPAPGRVMYACHLPGHYAYGMHGEIEVVPA